MSQAIRRAFASPEIRAYRSAMSMLTFYINRAEDNRSHKRKATSEKATGFRQGLTAAPETARPRMLFRYDRFSRHGVPFPYHEAPWAELSRTEAISRSSADLEKR